MIKIVSHTPDIIVLTNITYDSLTGQQGVEIQLTDAPSRIDERNRIFEIETYINNLKMEKIDEASLRLTNPAVMDAYNKYETVVALCKAGKLMGLEVQA
jgi:hypothetical protein